MKEVDRIQEWFSDAKPDEWNMAHKLLAYENTHLWIQLICYCFLFHLFPTKRSIIFAFTVTNLTMSIPCFPSDTIPFLTDSYAHTHSQPFSFLITYPDPTHLSNSTSADSLSSHTHIHHLPMYISYLWWQSNHKSCPIPLLTHEYPNFTLSHSIAFTIAHSLTLTLQILVCLLISLNCLHSHPPHQY